MDAVLGFFSDVLAAFVAAVIEPQPLCAAFGGLVALAVFANTTRIDEFWERFERGRGNYAVRKNGIRDWLLFFLLFPVRIIRKLSDLITGEIGALALVRWTVNLILIFILATYLAKAGVEMIQAALAAPAPVTAATPAK